MIHQLISYAKKLSLKDNFSPASSPLILSNKIDQSISLESKTSIPTLASSNKKEQNDEDEDGRSKSGKQKNKKQKINKEQTK